MHIGSYQDLIVWQKGMEVAEQCYLLTLRFPKEEIYGMISQIRRAGTSIPANIAEGWGRATTGEYIRFLRIAQGSTKELETLLLLTARVGLTSQQDIQSLLHLLAEVSRMTIALIASLRRRKGVRE